LRELNNRFHSRGCTETWVHGEADQTQQPIVKTYLVSEKDDTFSSNTVLLVTDTEHFSKTRYPRGTTLLLHFKDFTLQDNLLQLSGQQRSIGLLYPFTHAFYAPATTFLFFIIFVSGYPFFSRGGGKTKAKKEFVSGTVLTVNRSPPSGDCRKKLDNIRLWPGLYSVPADGFVTFFFLRKIVGDVFLFCSY